MSSGSDFSMSQRRRDLLYHVRLLATFYNLGIIKGLSHEINYFHREFKLQTERSRNVSDKS